MLRTFTHSLNSGMAGLAPYYRGRSVDLILTNVLYDGDAEMQRLVKDKHAIFGKPHFIARHPHKLTPLQELRAEGDILVLDNLNLLVSNIMLRYNTYPSPAVANQILRQIHYLTHILPILSQQYNEIHIFTSTVSNDVDIQSDSGKLYASLLAQANSAYESGIAKQVDSGKLPRVDFYSMHYGWLLQSSFSKGLLT